jgi:uncharacterized protein
MIALLISGLVLGALGSLHCVGMCGPIALALPIHQYSKFKKYLAVLLYNLGRATTYGLLGLVFGSIGQSFYLVNMQQSISIILGLFVLLTLVLSHTHALSFFKLNFLRQTLQVVKMQLSILFKKNGLYYLFLIGVLNGLLPCGLVYMAIAGAIVSGHAISGLLFMFAFGLGTFPIMLALIGFGQVVSIQYRNVLKKTMPYITTIMAILLIVRGLNLGIPYLSPKYEAQNNAASCGAHPKVLMQYCVPPKRMP